MELQNRYVSAIRLASRLIVFLAAVLVGSVRGQTGASKETARQPSSSATPTYYRDVQPILRQHCMVCHHADGIAPMSFETFDTARRYAYIIRTVTQAKAMPPQFAIPLVGKVVNDPSLTPAQISTLANWASLNTPEGDAQEAPPVPGAVAPWSIPKPDFVVKMAEPVPIPATGNLEYVYQIVPTHFTEGRWIQMAEVLPSMRANVLQIMVAIRRPGSPWLRHAPVGKPFTSALVAGIEDHRWADDDILLVYTSGSSVQEFPVTMGKSIPAGADLVFRVQYTTNGVAGSERSSVGLVFCKQAPSKRVITLALENARFTIPPNAPDYRVEAQGVLRSDVLLLSFFPLLHLRGKQFEYDVIPAPGATRDDLSPQMEILLRVKYDLRWQTSYPLSEPRLLKTGAELRAVAWYDNSPNNPNNPDPNASVNWGDQPRDEVLCGFFDVAVPATIGEHKILVRHR